MKAFFIILTASFALTAPQAGLAAATSVTVPMHAQSGSDQDGTAKLVQQGPNVVVTLSVAQGTTTPQPAHIHMGTCAKLDPAPKYPLTSLVNGKSTSTVKGVTLASLETGGFAINVHKSAAALKTYTSCGDIPKAM
jgi:hypothetical protein